MNRNVYPMYRMKGSRIGIVVLEQEIFPILWYTSIAYGIKRKFTPFKNCSYHGSKVGKGNALFPVFYLIDVLIECCTF